MNIATPHLTNRLITSFENLQALLLAPKYGLVSKEELYRLSEKHNLNDKLVNAHLGIISEHLSLEEAQQCEEAAKAGNIEEFNRILSKARLKIINFNELLQNALREITESIQSEN